MATLAGLLGLATAAIAVDPDATIVISRSLNSPTFSVRYSGAAVAMAELRVNGESITTRNLNASVTSGETSFNVNLATLLDGENEVEVRLFDKSGKLVGSQKSVVTQESSDKPAIFLTTPKLGATVQGAVDIKVGFGQKFKDSYVSFFIDNQFRTMSNVAPFDYVWDTGRENNGWHELEAWLVNGANDTLKSRKVRVFVDNPGGHTSRRFAAVSKAPVAAPVPKAPASDLITLTRTVPALTINSSPVKIVPAAPVAIAPVAPTLLPLTLLATAVPAKIAAPAGSHAIALVPTAAAATGLRHMTPTGKRLADRPAAKPSLKANAAPKVALTAKPAKPEVSIVRSSVAVESQGRVAMPGAPVTGMSVSHIKPLVEEIKPVSTGMVAMAPVDKAVKPAAQPVKAVSSVKAQPKVASKASSVKLGSTMTTLVKVVPGVKLPNKGSFAIIMDGDLVEFDVQPRVEASGVPMTPFRHLIEKKGGEVNWEAKTKEVNAKADGKEIYLQIGTRVAKINQKPVDLELAPYIESGRTIVPLSFIRETLKVNVDYDKATGHVLITSIK